MVGSNVLGIVACIGMVGLCEGDKRNILIPLTGFLGQLVVGLCSLSCRPRSIVKLSPSTGYMLHYLSRRTAKALWLPQDICRRILLLL